MSNEFIAANPEDYDEPFGCYMCQEELPFVYYNGYGVGDRVLEGVLFKCELNDDGTWDIDISERDAKYFSTLNEEMWLEEVREAVPRHDFFRCPECGGDACQISHMEEGWDTCEPIEFE